MNTRKLIKSTNLEKKLIRSSLDINYNTLGIYGNKVSYKNKDEKIDRQKNINKLSELLNEKYSKKIEESIYNFSKEYTEDNDTPFLLESVYSDKFNEIYNILINEKSAFLIDAIKSDKLDSSKIAMMRPDELNPDKYEKINKKKETLTKLDCEPTSTCQRNKQECEPTPLCQRKKEGSYIFITIN